MPKAGLDALRRRSPSERELVLLFYDGFELRANADLMQRVKGNIRARLRAAYRRAHGKQVNTGFYAAFLNLVAALRRSNYDVRINDFRLAERFPDYPIGLSGYPTALDSVAALPNPILFGPGDPGFPDRAREICETTNVRYIIQPSDWFVAYYQRYCGNRVVRWAVGLDTDLLSDQRSASKMTDVLIYDKIRWDHDSVYPEIIGKLEAHLRSRNLSYEIIRYGSHTYQAFLRKLRSARAFAFICEHETQGLACQEAMCMNLPVFAWDEGRLVDPQQIPFLQDDLAVSSVPYFGDCCGIKFQKSGIERRFDEFWSRREFFRPRDYIVENLTLASSAKNYIDILGRIGALRSLSDLSAQGGRAARELDQAVPYGRWP